MLKKAFTLVELLIVIAVISIVVSIIYPLLQKNHNSEVRNSNYTIQRN